uniref:Uncharacterized protein n=1 Tax=Anguilla anguilla TaxID=7936 RepID=A0A0E9QJE6_ANGAN
MILIQLALIVTELKCNK